MPTIETLTVDVEANTSKLKSQLAGAGVAVGLFAAGATTAFRAFEDAEAVSKQTAAALESTGGAANVSIEGIEAQAEALSNLTGIDDEAIQSAQNLLLTFTKVQNKAGEGNAIFDRATATVLDMSAAFDQSAKASAIQLGKALNDPIAGMTALARVGVTFTEEQKEQITTLQESGDLLGAQKIILGELATETEGSAEAQATASGKAATAFGNLTEALGGVAAKGLLPLLNLLRPVLAFLTKYPVVTAAIITAVTGATVAFKLYRAWTLLSAAAQKILLASAPWALIAVAVIALVVIVVKNWDKIKEFVLGVWEKIKDVWSGVVRFFADLWGRVKDGAIAVWNAIRDAFVNAFNGVRDFFVGIINGIIDGINAVIRAINVLPGVDFGEIAHVTVGGTAVGGSTTGGTSSGGNRTTHRSLSLNLDRTRVQNDLDVGTAYGAGGF